jgi:hypothetical protein
LYFLSTRFDPLDKRKEFEHNIFCNEGKSRLTAVFRELPVAVRKQMPSIEIHPGAVA